MYYKYGVACLGQRTHSPGFPLATPPYPTHGRPKKIQNGSRGRSTALEICKFVATARKRRVGKISRTGGGGGGCQAKMQEGGAYAPGQVYIVGWFEKLPIALYVSQLDIRVDTPPSERVRVD